MNYSNIDILDIDNIFISHLHGDHSGGMEFVGFKTYFSTLPFGQKKINIISSPKILKKLWKNQLKASMSSLTGKEKLSTYFNKQKEKKEFYIGNLRFILVKTFHAIMDNYGLFIENLDSGKKVFITGDTKFTPNYFKKYFQSADYIFHDCEFKNYPNSHHAQYTELSQKLPKDIKEKIFLYHYSLNGKSFEELDIKVKKDGFKLVKRGFEFSF